MIGWLRSLLTPRVDVGLEREAKRFGTKPIPAEMRTYSYDLAVKAVRKARARTATGQVIRKRKPEAAPTVVSIHGRRQA